MPKSITAEKQFSITPKQGILNKITEALAATFFCFLLIVLFNLLIGKPIHKIEKFNPLVNQVEDFEVSDYIFAFTHKTILPDSNIIIINCANDTRNQLAEKIGLIERAGAKAIGIDLLFEHNSDKNENTSLIDTLNRYKSNIVLAAVYDEKGETDTPTFDRPFYKQMMDSNNGDGTYNIGYLLPEDPLLTKRKFTPFLGPAAEDTSFAVKLVSLALGGKVILELAKRHNSEEIINYRNGVADLPRYTIVDNVPIKDELTGKVIILGTCDSNSILDRHYSPLNKSMGKSYPDIFGAAYHAQIVSMIITGDYINPLPWLMVWEFMVCFLFMFLFIRLFHFHSYYHFIIDILLIPTLFISLALSHYLLEWFSLKLEPKDFVSYIFACGLLLHLYYPFKGFLVKFKKVKRNKK